MINIPSYKRPREKLIELGARNVTDKELIAIILRTGSSKSNVLMTASQVLKKVRLEDLHRMSVQELQKVTGLGNAYASSLIAAMELSSRIKDSNSTSFTQPEQIIHLLHTITTKKQEQFVCIYLNARYNLLGKKTVSIGTINTSLAHPREVFRPAIEMGASYLVIAHNHPSGDPEPSDADIALTARMVEAGELVGIHIIDHIIVAEHGWISLKQKEIM